MRSPFHHIHTLPGRWPLLLLVLVVVMPLLVVLLAPLHTPTLHWAHIVEYTLFDQLGTTLLLVVCTVSLALLFGTVPAWLVSAYQFPLRGMMRWALVLPLTVPTYISAFNYAGLLGPTGTWSKWIRAHLGISIDIMDLPGMAFVLAVVLFPYIFLSARAAFSNGLGTMQDAARDLGLRDRHSFFRVALPLVRPAVFAGSLLVAMEVLNDYGAVKFFGVHTLTTGIFRTWFAMNDLGGALRIACVLLMLVIAFLIMEKALRGRAEFAFPRKPLQRRKLFGWKAMAAMLICFFPLLVGAIIPIGKIIFDAIATWSTTVDATMWLTIWHTLRTAVIATMLTLAVAMLLSYAMRYSRSRTMKNAIRMASLGYVIPGAVIAVGVLTAAGPLDRHVLPKDLLLIGSMGLLIFALLVRFLAVGRQPLQAGLKSTERTLEEAARTLGANPWRTFIRVNVPLLRGSMLAAAILIFVEVVKELPLTLILRPFNFDTLATKAFSMAGIEQLREASCASLLIVLIATLPILIMERQFNRNP